jgi:hypothetical protein
MTRLEYHNLAYDHDGATRLYLFTERIPPPPIRWSDGDICVCGVKCARHWNGEGDWIGCIGAGQGDE